MYFCVSVHARWCAGACVCAGAHTQVCIHVEARGQPQVYSLVTIHLLSLSDSIYYAGRLADSWAPGIHLPVSTCQVPKVNFLLVHCCLICANFSYVNVCMYKHVHLNAGRCPLKPEVLDPWSWSYRWLWVLGTWSCPLQESFALFTAESTSPRLSSLFLEIDSVT